MTFDPSIFVPGKYRFPDKDRRLVKFEGLRYREILTPTDIDLFMEFENRCFIFGEFKEYGVDMRYAQQLAFERLCRRAGHGAILFVAEHDKGQDDIIAADCRVRCYYRFFDGQWRWISPTTEINVHELIDLWLQIHKIIPEEET